MAPPFDPVLGLTGTLNAVQNQAPMATNATPQDNSGPQSLERAARSLESVQGHVGGQTQAIQQMTMAAQQQSAALQMLISQLGMQVAGLSQAIGGMSTAVRMSSPAMSQMAYPMTMGDMGGGGGGGGGAGFFRRAGGMAMAGGSAAASGLYSAGKPFGAMGGGFISPFFGTPVGAPGPGQIGPQMSQDVGLWRSAVMASGAGVDPRMMRTASGGALQQLGSERLQQNIADLGIGLTGGVARTAIGYGAGEAGMAIGGRLGLGMIGGGVAGMAIGGALAAPAGMALDEVMRQSAAQRGYGEQFGRSAFRMLGPQQTGAGGQGGFGALRKPGMQDRLKVGQAVNRMEIQDLTFGQQDMTEMFAGMTQNDLGRGVRNVDEVVQRFRATKETLKIIGRRMGQAVQEGSGTMGALQDIGVDPTSARGRAAIFGASSISGLTPTEGMQRSTGMAGTQWGARGGFGAGMLGVGQTSLQVGQTAIQKGVLNATQIAALGGREGTGEALQQMVTGYLQSGVGQASLVAGSRAMGKGAQETIAMAGQVASGSRAGLGRTIDVSMGGSKQIQEYLRDPRMLADIYGKVRDLSNMYMDSGVSGGSRERAMRMALSQTTGERNDASLDAMVQLLKPKTIIASMRDQQRQDAANLTADMKTATYEQNAIFAGAKRGVRGALAPVADLLTRAHTSAAQTIANDVESFSNAAYGLERTTVGGGLDTETLAALNRRGGAGLYAHEAVPAGSRATVASEVGGGGGGGAATRADESAAAHRNRLRDEQRAIMTDGAVDRTLKKKVAKQVFQAHDSARREEIAKIKDRINKGDGEVKRVAMEELLSVYGGDEYKAAKSGKDSSDPETKKKSLDYLRALQEEVGRATGESVDAAIIGVGGQAKQFSGEDRKRLGRLSASIGFSMNLKGELQGDNSDVMAMPEMAAYVGALAAGGEGHDEVAAVRKAAKKKGVNAELVVGALQTKAFQGPEGIRAIKDIQGMLTSVEGSGIGKGAGYTELRNRQQVEDQTQIMGEGYAPLMGELKKTKGRGKGLSGNIETRLKSSDSRVRIAAMAEMQAKLGKEDIEAIGGMEGGGPLAAILTQLQGVSGDMDTPEERDIVRKALTGRVRDDKMESTLDAVAQPGGMGVVMAKLGAGEGPSVEVLTKKGQGLSNEQAQAMVKMSDNALRLGLIVQELEQRLPKKKH